MNYQEALDFVKKSYPQGSKKWKEKVDILQELIDQQGDYMSYQDLKAEYEQKIKKLEEENDCLKHKAFGLKTYAKALDMLLDLSTQDNGICCTYGCPNKDEDMESGSCVGKCMTKEELKEYLLNGSEKQSEL